MVRDIELGFAGKKFKSLKTFLSLCQYLFGFDELRIGHKSKIFWCALVAWADWVGLDFLFTRISEGFFGHHDPTNSFPKITFFFHVLLLDSVGNELCALASVCYEFNSLFILLLMNQLLYQLCCFGAQLWVLNTSSFVCINNAKQKCLVVWVDIHDFGCEFSVL